MPKGNYHTRFNIVLANVDMTRDKLCPIKWNQIAPYKNKQIFELLYLYE